MATDEHLRHWRAEIAIGLGYLALFLLVDALTAVRPAYAIGVTPWNPGAALSLTYLIVRRADAITFVLAGYLIAARVSHAPAIDSATLLVAGMLSTAIYAVLARLIRSRISTGDHATVTDTVSFLAGAACAVFAAVSAQMAWFAWRGYLPTMDMGSALLRQGFADLNAILMLTPLLLLALQTHALRRIRPPLGALAMQLGAVLLTMAALFALTEANQLRYFYLLFLPITWIGLRWGMYEALAGACVAQLALIGAAQFGIHAPRFVDLQVFMLTLTMTALLLGALVLDRRRISDELRARDVSLNRAMQFAVAGELASALTHELSQPVAATIAYLETANTQIADPRENATQVATTLAKARAAATRAAEVLQRLRGFYRGAEARNDIIDIAATCLRASQALADRMRASGTQFELDAPEPMFVSADERQLEIVLQNLLTNALEAMEEAGSPQRRLLLRVGRETGSVVISCEDSGPGVAAAQAARLFDPFVTSKTSGMGLGLSISRKLVRAMGGEMTSGKSQKLGGAALVVRLPQAQDK